MSAVRSGMIGVAAAVGRSSAKLMAACDGWRRSRQVAEIHALLHRQLPRRRVHHLLQRVVDVGDLAELHHARRSAATAPGMPQRHFDRHVAAAPLPHWCSTTFPGPEVTGDRARRREAVVERSPACTGHRTADVQRHEAAVGVGRVEERRRPDWAAAGTGGSRAPSSACPYSAPARPPPRTVITRRPLPA